MEASELRIGNYIYTRSGVLREVRPNDITNFAHSVTMDGPMFLSIPLTEEWILKFGLDRDFLPDFGIPVYLEVMQNEKYFIFKRSGMEIRYVHQLQNLYFAFTGEELKTN